MRNKLDPCLKTLQRPSVIRNMESEGWLPKSTWTIERESNFPQMGKVKFRLYSRRQLELIDEKIRKFDCSKRINKKYKDRFFLEIKNEFNTIDNVNFEG